MRVSFSRQERGSIEFGALYGGIALAGLLAVSLLPIARILPSCAFKGLTGMPCPTCGFTRAAVALSRGSLTTAISMNPLLSILVIAALLAGAYSAITFAFRMKRVRISLDRREGNAVRAAAVLLFFLNWLYLCLFL